MESVIFNIQINDLKIELAEEVSAIYQFHEVPSSSNFASNYRNTNEFTVFLVVSSSNRYHTSSLQPKFYWGRIGGTGLAKNCQTANRS